MKFLDEEGIEVARLKMIQTAKATNMGEWGESPINPKFH